MNKRRHLSHQIIYHFIPESILRRMDIVLFFLFFIFFPITAKAQFIKIDIDIPAKTGISDMEISGQNWQSEYNQNMQELEGSYSLTLSSAENLQVLAILKHSDYLINASGIGVKFNAVLAYQNDGKNRPIKANSSDRAQFPMSNSGLLIDYMKDSPQVLNAYIVVYTTIERPKTSGSTYIGDILLTIEYN